MKDRTKRPIKVLFLCLGNICRSPLAEGIFEHVVNVRGWSDRFEADSAGTSSYHQGEAPDPGSIRIAAEFGLDISHQRSRQLRADDFRSFDFIIPMDRSNKRDALKVGHLPDERLVLIREFDPEARDFDVPDPYGGGKDGFVDVYRILERSMDGLITHILHHGTQEQA